MNQILVVGKTNVGKTLFSLNFAAHLGMKSVQITFKDARTSHTKSFSVPEAIELFVSGTEHQTKCLQSLLITLPWGKGTKQCELIDSTGLVSTIHPTYTFGRPWDKHLQRFAKFTTCYILLTLRSTPKSMSSTANWPITEPILHRMPSSQTSGT